MAQLCRSASIQLEPQDARCGKFIIECSFPQTLWSRSRTPLAQRRRPHRLPIFSRRRTQVGLLQHSRRPPITDNSDAVCSLWSKLSCAGMQSDETRLLSFWHRCQTISPRNQTEFFNWLTPHKCAAIRNADQAVAGSRKLTALSAEQPSTENRRTSASSP